MKQYIGTKQVSATPMTKAEYNEYRNWDLPEDEDGTEEGYLVEYEDSNPNHPDHKGYISWSPKKQFDDAYSTLTLMTFGHAIEMMKQGHKVFRKGWNGNNQFVVLMPSLYLPSYNTQDPGAKVSDRTAKFIGKDMPLDAQPYFAMMTAQGRWQPGWLASQADMLSNDWSVL